MAKHTINYNIFYKWSTYLTIKMLIQDALFSDMFLNLTGMIRSIASSGPVLGVFNIWH